MRTKRQDETQTEFSLRLMRAEHFEQAATIAEQCAQRVSDPITMQQDAWNRAVAAVARAIRCRAT